MTETEFLAARSPQQRKAEHFHALHRERVLVLPNPWDVVTAALVERAGASAIATTSAGLSWSLGAPDGEHIGWGAALEQLRRIARAVDVPVSIDIEGGYSDVETTVTDVIDIGAVGVNIEDSTNGRLLPIVEMCERVARVRAVADIHGLNLFINARTDTFLLGVLDAEAESLRRSSAYIDAGADGIFVPGLGDKSTITALVAGIRAPLNIMVAPGSPSVADLASLGVARVSAGMALAQAAYAAAQGMAIEMLERGTYSKAASALDYGYFNQTLTN